MSQTLDCPCNYEADFGGLVCEKPKAGVDNCMVFLCGSSVSDVQRLACDAANPTTTGQIIGITKVAGEIATRFFAAQNVTAIESGEELTDNDSIQVNESVVTRGSIASSEICYLKAHMGKEGLLFFIDNNGKLWCMGWDGGFYLWKWNRVWGVTSADTTGVDVEYKNTTDQTALEVDYVTAGFATADLFLDSLFA